VAQLHRSADLRCSAGHQLFLIKRGTDEEDEGAAVEEEKDDSSPWWCLTAAAVGAPTTVETSFPAQAASSV
jgi:hypothetical protein